MARSRRDNLRFAEEEARHFARSQIADAKKLGYPTRSAFAYLVARGTVSLAPIPEDERDDRMGRFFWNQMSDIERRLMIDAFGDLGDTPKTIATRLGISVARMYRMIDRILERLAGYLGAFK